MSTLRSDLIRLASELSPGDPMRLAVIKLLAGKEDQDFVEWCVNSRDDKMSAGEMKRAFEQLGVKFLPWPKRRSGPRYQPGDKVVVDKTKHNLKKFDTPELRAVYDKYHRKTGVVQKVDSTSLSVWVRLDGVSGDVMFPGALSKSRIGLMKFSPPYDASPKVKTHTEIVYFAGGKSQSDDQMHSVQLYIDRGEASKTEQRSMNRYSGYIYAALISSKGPLVRMGAQQRMRIVDGQPMDGHDWRSFSANTGSFFYIGKVGQRPSGWKEELASQREQAKAAETTAA